MSEAEYTEASDNSKLMLEKVIDTVSKGTDIAPEKAQLIF